MDAHFIDETAEAKLTVAEIAKHAQKPLFAEDKPWEPRFDNLYANVIYDKEDNIYKLLVQPDDYRGTNNNHT